MSMHDSTFEYLPLPALSWAAPSPTQPLPPPSPNRAFLHAYALATLPEFYAWADGSHTLRLAGCGRDQPLCRVYLCTLPDHSRLGLIENVQDDYQDPLTGLDTLRSLRLDLAAHPGNVGLALLDVDDFKAVNDAHGHAAGDAVLVALAGLLRATARLWNARAYRLGGDEFVLLSAETLEPTQLRGLQTLFRRSAAQSGLEVQGFSYGLSSAPRSGQSLCDLLEQADAQLMRQKLERRGTRTAPLLPHLEGHAPHPEVLTFQMSWPAHPPSGLLNTENG